MGPGQAAALPGRPIPAGPSAGAAGDRGSWSREDRPVHGAGVAHLEGRPGGRVGAALPGLPLLPEGGPEEPGAVEVRPGAGGAAEGLTAALSWVRRHPQLPFCGLGSGASDLSERP